MVEHPSTEPPPPTSLDILDYLTEAWSIPEHDVQALLDLPRFQAAALAFGRTLLPLGYAAFFSWRDAVNVLPGLTPSRLMNLVYYTARRSGLDKSNLRYVALDDARLRAEFPDLFRGLKLPIPQQPHKEFLKEMGEFGAEDQRRNRYISDIDRRVEGEHILHWLRSSPDRLRPLLNDRRFLAGLDAHCQEYLSYGGFAECVYGSTGYVLFPELGWNGSRTALWQLAHMVDTGEIGIPNGLRDEFPEFYELNNPEAFGPKQA